MECLQSTLHSVQQKQSPGQSEAHTSAGTFNVPPSLLLPSLPLPPSPALLPLPSAPPATTQSKVHYCSHLKMMLQPLSFLPPLSPPPKCSLLSQATLTITPPTLPAHTSLALEAYSLHTHYRHTNMPSAGADLSPHYIGLLTQTHSLPIPSPPQSHLPPE